MGTMAAEVSADVPNIVEVVVPSITRTWDPVSLLYDNQWHDSAEVDEEIENTYSLLEAGWDQMSSVEEIFHWALKK